MLGQRAGVALDNPNTLPYTRNSPYVAVCLAAQMGAGIMIWELAADAFSKTARNAGGDVLVFMPGGYEINRTIEAIRHAPASRTSVILGSESCSPFMGPRGTLRLARRCTITTSSAIARTLRGINRSVLPA